MAVDMKRISMYNEINHHERSQVIVEFIEKFGAKIESEVKPLTTETELTKRKRPISMFKLG
jgi:hypothetical protein